MQKSQRGFTITELLDAIVFVVWLAIVCSMIYVVFHFITKFW